MDSAGGGGEGEDGVENGGVDDDNNTQVREDDACSEVETEGALASSEGYSADYSESISSGSSSSSSNRRESRDTMGHVHTKDGGDEVVDVKGTPQKKLDAASPSRNDLHNGQQQVQNDTHDKRRHSASNIEQNTHRHRHHHNKELDMNRQMDEIMNLYNVR